MSLRQGENAASRALARVRPDLLAHVKRPLSKRQSQALSAWKRLGKAKDVAAELGISISATQQLLSLAGAIKLRPSHVRRQAVAMFKDGHSVDEVRGKLRLHRVSLELAIGDYAEELAEAAEQTD